MQDENAVDWVCETCNFKPATPEEADKHWEDGHTVSPW